MAKVADVSSLFHGNPSSEANHMLGGHYRGARNLYVLGIRGPEGDIHRTFDGGAGGLTFSHSEMRIAHRQECAIRGTRAGRGLSLP